ncbi:MAG: hypothetical protein ACJ8C4_00705 [Gemmataceae bacterium]
MQKTDPASQAAPFVPVASVPNPGPPILAGGDTRLATEVATYQRELPRLLAEGREGQFVLIRGSEIIGLFPSWDDARNVGLNRYSMTPFFVKQIAEKEPYLKIRGVNRPWGVKSIQ